MPRDSDDVVPLDALWQMMVMRARLDTVTAAERNAPPKKRPPGKENFDPDLDRQWPLRR